MILNEIHIVFKDLKNFFPINYTSIAQKTLARIARKIVIGIKQKSNICVADTEFPIIVYMNNVRRIILFCFFCSPTYGTKRFWGDRTVCHRTIPIFPTHSPHTHTHPNLTFVHHNVTKFDFLFVALS